MGHHLAKTSEKTRTCAGARAQHKPRGVPGSSTRGLPWLSGERLHGSTASGLRTLQKVVRVYIVTFGPGKHGPGEQHPISSGPQSSQADSSRELSSLQLRSNQGLAALSKAVPLELSQAQAWSAKAARTCTTSGQSWQSPSTLHWLSPTSEVTQSNGPGPL